jgi:hypothetical protein
MNCYMGGRLSMNLGSAQILDGAGSKREIIEPLLESVWAEASGTC